MTLAERLALKKQDKQDAKAAEYAATDVNWEANLNTIIERIELYADDGYRATGLDRTPYGVYSQGVVSYVDARRTTVQISQHCWDNVIAPALEAEGIQITERVAPNWPYRNQYLLSW